jgi:uncharacterized protein YbcI
MVDSHTEAGVQPVLAAVSKAMVALHKEQFGRGPTRARSHFAGNEVLVCVLEDALLPAELSMVRMGDQQRVRESRTYLQVATADAFVATIESLVHRKVRGFSSATDPDANMVFEIFAFESDSHPHDGRRADSVEGALTPASGGAARS